MQRYTELRELEVQCDHLGLPRPKLTPARFFGDGMAVELVGHRFTGRDAAQAIKNAANFVLGYSDRVNQEKNAKEIAARPEPDCALAEAAILCKEVLDAEGFGDHVKIAKAVLCLTNHLLLEKANATSQ